MHLPRLRLRSQLALAIAGVGLLAIVVNAALMSTFLNSYLLDQQKSQIREQAAALGGCCKNFSISSLFARPGALDEAMQVALRGTPQRHAIIVGSKGRLRYASSSLPQPLLQALLTQVRHDLAGGRPSTTTLSRWNEVISDVPLSYGGRLAGRTVGWLLLAENQQVVTARWQATVSLVLISGIAAIVLAMLGAMVAAQTITRPIRALTNVARSIAAGDYERRVAPSGPSEMRELAQAFDTMMDEVLHQRRVERDLLANVSHELAAPLGLIRGYAEALADGMIGGEKERLAALHAISGETTRLGRLSGDLLDLALLETGQVSVQLESVPVADLLAGLHERFMPKAARAGIVLALEMPPGLPSLLTDGLRLEGVLVNLLNNALRHTPTGGTITLRAHVEGAELCLAVSDTGSGIPQEDLARIWERFYQVDKGRDRRDGEAGVGLGLAICRSTITLLGGRINAESTPGAGTTFTIWLPLRRVSAPAA